MSAPSLQPTLDAQLRGGPQVAPEPGGLAWWWRRGDLHLVKVVGKAEVRFLGGAAAGWAVVVDGRVLVVDDVRLTAVPTVDPDPTHA